MSENSWNDNLSRSYVIPYWYWPNLKSLPPRAWFHEYGVIRNTDLADLHRFTIRTTPTPSGMHAPSRFSSAYRAKTDLNRAVSLCILPLFCAFLQEKRGYPTPENAILHPILHTKSPVITGILGYGCRKCRIFSKNFFCRRKKEHAHRKTRSIPWTFKNIRTFEVKHPYF